jgi:hydroxyacylglutathione hydrolase
MPAVEHLRTEVVDCRLADSAAVLTLRDGASLTAEAVVLAVGNFEPAALNGVSAEAVESGVYCYNAWDPRTYEGLAADAPVVLIGTGLTSVDVLLRLRELGHRGTVTGVSRHGMMPGRHEPYESLDVCAIAADAPATALEYLRAFRAALRNETDWRAVVDSLRENTNALWLALPREEQMRFRRHLQRRWDVVRHRMAPSIADEIERELGDGSFVLCGGRLESMTVEDGGAKVEVRTRDGVRCRRAARVINCTGPSMNYREVRSPLLQSLLRRGLAVPGELGSGLRTDAAGALFGGDGGVSDRLFTLGPPRMGTLLESIAIPEICQQAVALADQLIEKLNSSKENSGLSRADAAEVVGA